MIIWTLIIQHLVYLDFIPQLSELKHCISTHAQMLWPAILSNFCLKVLSSSTGTEPLDLSDIKIAIEVF